MRALGGKRRLIRVLAILGFLSSLVTLPLSGRGQEGLPLPAPRGFLRVIDGNTMFVRGMSIRLFGIDAPEQRQECGYRGGNWNCGRLAARALARRIGKGVVRCVEKWKDRHGRSVAVCFAGEVNLNAWMVSEGWALADPEFAEDFAKLETSAAEHGKGIWRGDFVNPWDWRRGVRLRHLPSRDESRRECPIKGAIHPSGARIFYPPRSRVYDRIKIDSEKGERWFCSEEEALEAGWIKTVP